LGKFQSDKRFGDQGDGGGWGTGWKNNDFGDDDDHDDWPKTQK
jgi:hypothetical protein